MWLCDLTNFLSYTLSLINTIVKKENHLSTKQFANRKKNSHPASIWSLSRSVAKSSLIFQNRLHDKQEWGANFCLFLFHGEWRCWLKTYRLNLPLRGALNLQFRRMVDDILGFYWFQRGQVCFVVVVAVNGWMETDLDWKGEGYRPRLCRDGDGVFILYIFVGTQQITSWSCGKNE